MINKLVVDGQNITLNESTVLPFTYTFSTAGVHNVRVGLDNTNEICAYAFKDCENLTKVVNIPEQITMIKRNAFENCTSLTIFNVPTSIEYIGPNVFDGCVGLREIKFNTYAPPRFFSNLEDYTTCYIPDGGKFVKVEDNSELIKDGSVQYYEKNILGGYDEIDFEALENDGEYYYDNWTTVHDHYNVVEERFRIKPTQIEFLDNGIPTTLYGDINAGDKGDIFEHHLIPDNCTNPNVFIYSTNENVLQVDQNGHFTTNSSLLGNANVNVCICTEPDYYGTYAFTQLRFRVRAGQVAPEKTNMTLEFNTDKIEVTDVNIGDIIEINAPVLSGDDNLVNPTITYSSSNENVVVIVDNSLTIVGEGTATITATYAGDTTHTGATATISVNVSLKIEEQEKVNPELLFSSDSLTITDENNYVLPTLINTNNVQLSWTSSDESVATVNANGEISIISNGTTTITATFDGNEEFNPKTISYELIINIINENDNIIETEFDTDENGNVQLINTDNEGTLETEFDTDENGDVQLINIDNEGTLETEFDTDENGDAQLINTDNE